MRKLIIANHISLDGFVATEKREIDWIKLDEDMFDLVGKMTEEADAALYGRVTWEMMNAYWPTAADKPNASKHDIEHSQWYNRVEKIVLSRSMKGKATDKTVFIGDNVKEEISKIKNKPGKNILIFGSPTAVHALMKYDLIDEFWLFVNPILLGKGLPMFADVARKIEMKLLTTKVFRCGVTALHYSLDK